MRFIPALVLGVVALFGLRAEAVLITFDDLPATITSEVPDSTTQSGFRAVRNGALTELILSAGGVTVTITRENDAPFDIVDNTLQSQQNKNPSFGSRSLDPYVFTGNQGFIFNFSDPIKTFSILGGDFGQDYDRLQLRAFFGQDLSGGLVPGSFQEEELPRLVNQSTWTQARFHTSVEESGDPGFRSVLFRAGNGFNFSAFFDRVFFDLGLVPSDPFFPGDDELNDPENQGDPTTLIPEPATLVLFAAGGALAFTPPRKRHRR